MSKRKAEVTGAQGSAKKPKTGKEVGYKGFGSFHSDNVEDLLAREDLEACPFDIEDLFAHEESLASVKMGKEMKAYFLLDFSWTFLNHGAFGGVATVPHEVSNRWREYTEKQPLRSIDRDLFPNVVAAVRSVAEFLHGDPSRVVLTQSATVGLNAAITGVALRPGDEVYMLSVRYGSVLKMVEHECDQRGATIREIDITYPLSGPEAIIALVRETIKANGKAPRLAIFDHITSNQAIVLPVAELAKVCKNAGVDKVIVDGAHAPLALELDLEALGAAGVDYYAGNFHKWACAPRGSAFLWRNDGCVARPPIISHGYGSGYLSEFVWDGNRDYSPWLALPATLRFWKAVGIDRSRDYMHDLARAAGEMLAGAWSTDTLVPPSLAATMVLVRLPAGVGVPEDAPGFPAHAKVVQDKLHTEHKIEVPVKSIADKLYVRISAHVYNEMAEFERLRDVVLDLPREKEAMVCTRGGGCG